MAKMLNLLMLVVLTQVALILFVYGPSGIPGGALWDFLRNPSDWSSTSLISLFADTLLVTGASLIVVGTFFYKSDFVTFSGITLTFMSFGSSLYNLWTYIQSNTGAGGEWIALMFISPIILMYLYVVLEFWRGIA